MQIHPTVNVSRLKRFEDGAAKFPSREVEEWRPKGVAIVDANGQMEWEVEKVLAVRGGRKEAGVFGEMEGIPVVGSDVGERSELGASTRENSRVHGCGSS